jgi:hypothetical protein
LLTGEPLPERMPLCFVDARRGRAVRQAKWAPPGGIACDIAVCAADAVRLAESPSPIAPRPEPVSRLTGAQPRTAKFPPPPVSAPQPQVSGKRSSGKQTYQLAVLSYRPACLSGDGGRGQRRERTFQWPGRGYYQVRSAGAWSLSAT